jgi:hypothetical protein
MKMYTQSILSINCKYKNWVQLELEDITKLHQQQRTEKTAYTSRQQWQAPFD